MRIPLGYGTFGLQNLLGFSHEQKLVYAAFAKGARDVRVHASLRLDQVFLTLDARVFAVVDNPVVEPIGPYGKLRKLTR